MQLDFFNQLFERSEKETKIARKLSDGVKNIAYLRDQLEIAYNNDDFTFDFYQEVEPLLHQMYSLIDLLRYQLHKKNRYPNLEEPRNLEEGISRSFLGVYNGRSTTEWYIISKRDFGRLKDLILGNSKIFDKDDDTKGVIENVGNVVDLVINKFKEVSNVI